MALASRRLIYQFSTKIQPRRQAALAPRLPNTTRTHPSGHETNLRESLLSDSVIDWQMKAHHLSHSTTSCPLFSIPHPLRQPKVWLTGILGAPESASIATKAKRKLPKLHNPPLLPARKLAPSGIIRGVRLVSFPQALYWFCGDGAFWTFAKYPPIPPPPSTALKWVSSVAYMKFPRC